MERDKAFRKRKLSLKMMWGSHDREREKERLHDWEIQ